MPHTWIGGGDNDASNPNNWSPASLPQADEGELPMTGLTINFSHYDLPQGDYLGTSLGEVTVNLADNSEMTFVSYYGPPNTINVSGQDTMVIASAYETSDTVNLENNAHWTGNLFAAYSNTVITVNGAEKAKFINDSSVNTGVFTGLSRVTAHAVINADVSGEGGFDVNSAGTLTFNKSVGSNQTIDVAASADVIINDPKDFNGLVNLGAASIAGEPTGGGRIDLNGLAKVDSYSFKNDMLKLYDGNKVVDTLRMHNSDPDFFVTKTVAGVSIYGSSTPVNIGLPVHHDLVG